VPPLIVTQEQLDWAIARFHEVLVSAEAVWRINGRQTASRRNARGSARTGTSSAGPGSSATTHGSPETADLPDEATQ
jgi:hypothetical protein